MSGTETRIQSYSTPVKLRGRRLFTIFAVFNAFSYLLLSGNILTLFLLRLNASRTIVGLVSSFLYVSFFFMLVGKRFGVKLGAVRLFAAGWALRYLTVAPLVAIPWMHASGMSEGAIVVFVLSTFAFNVFRGIGLVGQSPILGELSSGADRGSFLLKFQIIANVIAVFAGIGIAVLLGDDAPLARYAAFIGAGVAFGLVATAVVARVPEPPGVKEGGSERLSTAVRRTLSDFRFRRFLLAFGSLALISGAARPFLIVYAREVYSQADSAAIAYGVIGNLGAIAMGLFIKLLLDRTGAKPLILASVLITLIGFGPAVVSPQAGPLGVALILSFVFFVSTFGAAGAESCAQSYWYALLKPSDQMNMGIIYFLVLGIGGSLGSFGGGIVLDALHAATGGTDPVTVHQWYYGGILAAVVLLFVLFSRLERLGAYSFRGAIGVFFSMRDLRTMTLLDRLDRASDIERERAAIRSLGDTGSRLARESLLKRLDSPSYSIRSETLIALERLEPHRDTEHALIRELADHPYTTAYLAARILRHYGSKHSLKALREAVYSDDYVLCGEAMTSLGHRNDRNGGDRIEMVLRLTDNPHLMIRATEAIRLLRRFESIPLLFGALSGDAVPEYIRDEVILAVADLAGIHDWFYSLYVRFLSDQYDAIEFLKERASKASSSAVIRILELLLVDPARFAEETAVLLRSQRTAFHSSDTLANMIESERIYRFERVRFLFGAIASALPDELTDH
ncbi:MAG: MFS transporter [Spirochaetaceae bacterium]